MPPLKRCQSNFIYSSGVRREISIVSLEPDLGVARRPHDNTLPPQVILVYRGKSRAYGRGRLAYLEFEDVLKIFERDFSIVKSPSRRCILDEGFSVTFYRTHGDGDAALPVLIDPASWHELLRNVTRIEVGSGSGTSLVSQWWKDTFARLCCIVPRIMDPENLNILANCYAFLQSIYSMRRRAAPSLP